ncbi:MAG: response regulator transcription factor [Anaerovoracaceae bacterium]
MKRILLLEDDSALGRGIQLALQGPGVEITLFRTLAEGRAEIQNNTYDLLILDVNLPDGSGLALLQEVRLRSSVPVILLTANDLEMDVVTGLESGADDYITKPFSLAILRARVNAQLRRGSAGVPSRYDSDGFIFDFDAMEFRRDGSLIELSRTEQKLLRILVENRGQTVPRGVLMDRIWTDGAAYVEENALSVTVKRLRDKLEEAPSHPRYLKTVYGVGYTWAVKG